MKREIHNVSLGEDLILKIGIHAGPCVAVEQNERLDYFGSTVNVASRVQQAAEADEIVITDTIYKRTGVQEFLESEGLKVQEEITLLKGIGRAITFYRLF